ncbi:MAG: hypothetical protein ACRDCB_04190 [Clostridium sp.]|uniref:hypothetical protein n=1 Tax=Clostridium TaxID=1485 RepID=UPI00215378D8|nr:hypothetical protein [Clostridium sp. LY3-2]MCR6516226.1 hypothetical protein [Clostridium sp. LY3-2]
MFTFCLILVGLLILGSLFVVFSYENKLKRLKRDLVIANSHVTNLRSKLPKDSNSKFRGNESSFSSKEKLEIEFLLPKEPRGILNENSNILLAPTLNSPILLKTNLKMEVIIIDRANHLGIYWYYVLLPVDSNINSRGWVKKTDFTYFYSNSNNITKA